MGGPVFIHHEGESQLLATFPGQGQANESSTIARHKVDVFRSGMASSHDQITFVLPILVIKKDDHSPLANLLD
jgi:hypothetical protein